MKNQKTSDNKENFFDSQYVSCEESKSKEPAQKNDFPLLYGI